MALMPAEAALGTAARPAHRALHRLGRWLTAAGLAAAAAAGVLGGLPQLDPAARWTLLVFAGAVIAWTVLDLDETPVALAGALALLAPPHPSGSTPAWAMTSSGC